jgi:predicted ester cyclase
MSIEENKALIQRYIEAVWNQGNVDVLDELYDARFNGGGYGGVAGLKAAITSYRTSFPDLHFTIEEAIAEEDKIAFRWIARGTHLGLYEGIAPTAKPITVTGITILRIVDGHHR